jgi:hypothetical protein
LQNDSFDTAITAVEEVYTANANMPGARDIDEDYDTGPQSPVGKGLDGARNEVCSLYRSPHLLWHLLITIGL